MRTSVVIGADGGVGEDVRMRPMLATKGDRVPSGEQWVHEVKWDGMRVLADVRRDGVRLTSRTERDVGVAFPELHDLAGPDLLLDGEVVVLADGRPSFGALADRFQVTRGRRAAALAASAPATYLIFDVLRIDGADLTGRPLHERRRRLLDLGLADVAWQVPDQHEDGPLLLEATRQQDLEGIVSKRVDSRYEIGQRSRSWLKFAHRRRDSYVIGGWRPEVGSDQRLGAVLVGEPTAAGLAYRGRVGGGIAGPRRRELAEALAGIARERSPFDDEVPRPDAEGARWVEPVLVVEVEALGLSTGGRLRQPILRGLRPDLGVEELRIEERG